MHFDPAVEYVSLSSLYLFRIQPNDIIGLSPRLFNVETHYSLAKTARVSSVSPPISNYKYCLLTRQQGERVLLQINDNRRPLYVIFKLQ